MRDREHPHPDLLLRFLDGETSKTETRAVVRHLLAGCAACSATLRKSWKPPEGPPQRQDRPYDQAKPLNPIAQFQPARRGRA